MTDHPWCDGKTSYPTKAKAMDRIRHHKRDRYRKRSHKCSFGQGRVLMPYLCTTCRQWHVGGAYKDMEMNKLGHPERRRNGSPERPAT